MLPRIRFTTFGTLVGRSLRRIGFPIHRRGNELWKYTDLRQIDWTEFRFGVPSSSVDRDELNQRVSLADAWHNVVFVDGELDASLSDTGDAPVGSALKSVADFDRLGELADCTDNAFAALNTAFLGDGVFVEIEGGSEVEKPIHLVFVTTDTESRPARRLSANRDFSRARADRQR